MVKAREAVEQRWGRQGRIQIFILGYEGNTGKATGRDMGKAENRAGLVEEEFLQAVFGGEKREERKVVAEARAGFVAWSLPPSVQNQKLMLDSMPVCACTCRHTWVHLCACLSTVTWTGVNKSAAWFNNSRGDVTGKQEGTSRLFLACCGYSCLTRPARRQALCR